MPQLLKDRIEEVLEQDNFDDFKAKFLQLPFLHRMFMYALLVIVLAIKPFRRRANQLGG